MGTSNNTLLWLSERLRRSWQGLDGAIHARSEQSVLSFSSDRFLIGELLLGSLSETVVVVGNAPHAPNGLKYGPGL
jgi:hypothetical protein